jgi:hypothetical protein
VQRRVSILLAGRPRRRRRRRCRSVHAVRPAKRGQQPCLTRSRRAALSTRGGRWQLPFHDVRSCREQGRDATSLGNRVHIRKTYVIPLLITQILRRTASSTSCVVLFPPKSGVRCVPSRITSSTACSILSPARSYPRWRSIIAADRIDASGFAMFLPTISGADPCTLSRQVRHERRPRPHGRTARR